MKRSGGSWTPVFDYMLALLGIFMILAIVEKPHATPMRIDTLGLYAITMTWPDGSNDDIDLWVQNPNGDIAWFGSTSAGGMTLSGDVLGCASGTGFYDPKTHKCSNLERTLIKQVIPGEYTVNVQAYSKTDPGPVKATVTLTELRGNDRVVITKTILLTRQGQEETAFRFTLNRNGDASNFNQLPKRFVGVPNSAEHNTYGSSTP